MKAFRLQLESERQVRHFIAQNVPEFASNTLPMSQRNQDIVMANCVYFPDLVALVTHYLDLLGSSQRQRWHGGVIPPAEIWVKLGGDHGGGSFKFVMQIANTVHPNSLTNTIPVSTYDTTDSPVNLEVALSRFRTEIQQLLSAKWKDHVFRLLCLEIMIFKPSTMAYPALVASAPASIVCAQSGVWTVYQRVASLKKQM